MSPARWFEIAHWLTLIGPVAIAGILFLLPRPRRAWLRVSLAVFVGWLVALALNVYVYNPAGIAYGHSIGEQFPENRFDNNTTAVTFLVGWIPPATMCAVLAIVRFVRSKLATLRRD